MNLNKKFLATTFALSLPFVMNASPVWSVNSFTLDNNTTDELTCTLEGLKSHVRGNYKKCDPFSVNANEQGKAFTDADCPVETNIPEDTGVGWWKIECETATAASEKIRIYPTTSTYKLKNNYIVVETTKGTPAMKVTQRPEHKHGLLINGL